jgi:predicted nucleic acid-binding protein
VVTSDESDNRYVECAVESGASYIVTGDPHLLNIDTYKGVVIITPATFVALLDSNL